MKKKTCIALSLLAAGAVMESSAAIVGNLLADPGFEAIAGNEPNTNTAPWFTIDEQNNFHIVPTTEEANSGVQSARFTFYFNKGAVAQNTGVQIEAGTDYEMSAWVMVRDKGPNAAHTNRTTLNLTLATSPAVDGSYAYRVASFGNAPTTTNEWQYFSTVFHANQLTNWVGEYIQPRFAKGNQNTEYRILIDDVSFGVATNELADSGFEGLTGNEPNTNSLPWFTIGEGSNGSFTRTTDQKHSGSQSVVWQFYFDNGSIVQNLDKQFDASKTYEMSAWLLTAEPSATAAHTNAPTINFGLYASTNSGVSYAFVTTVLGGILNSTTDVWEKFSATVDGADLPAWAMGGDIQIRFNRPNENVTHKVYIDDVSFLISDAPVPPGGYGPWADAYGIGGPGDDDDGDGLSNLYEYGIGGDPTNSADTGYAPVVATLAEGGTNWFEYVHARRISPDNGLVYYLEQNTDLVFGTWTNTGDYVVGTGALDADFESVTNRIPTTGKQKEFVRLVIEQEELLPLGLE